MPIAEITRSETRERARLLRVDDYDIALDLTRGRGSVRLHVGDPVPLHPGRGVDLRRPGGRDRARDRAQRGSIDPAGAWADGRIALTGLDEHNVLRVVADGRYSSTGAGLHRTVDSADGKVYTYTNFEPAEARKAYANFEQPDLKAAFTFHVTAPAHWTVRSNQPTPEPEPADGGTALWHFPATPRISTYLTAVVAGEYHWSTPRTRCPPAR